MQSSLEKLIELIADAADEHVLVFFVVEHAEASSEGSLLSFIVSLDHGAMIINGGHWVYI